MNQQGVHRSAILADSAELGEGVAIGPGAVIEETAKIGDGTVIEANAFVGAGAVVGSRCRIGVGAVVREGVIIDDDVSVGCGAVLGTDGFGYVFDGNTHFKIPQVGTVHIGAGSIVESGSCIDRATTGVTEVGANSHIGPMVMIGHNCSLGHDCQVGFQVGLAGSSRMGDNCVLGPQSGMVMRAELGNDCKVEFRGALLRKFGDGCHVAGYPARPIAEVRRLEAAVRRLPDLLDELGVK